MAVARKRTTPAPAVGSRVKLTFAGREIVATVVEDRGNIGIGGRRLLRIRVELTGGAEPLEFEVPAADVSVAGDRSRTIRGIRMPLASR